MYSFFLLNKTTARTPKASDELILLQASTGKEFNEICYLNCKYCALIGKTTAVIFEERLQNFSYMKLILHILYFPVDEQAGSSVPIPGSVVAIFLQG